MTTKRAQVAIVGSGPAGIAAALEAATAGASVVLVDLYPQPGGHYFKQPFTAAQSSGSPNDARQSELEGLLAALKRLGVQILTETSVWNITRDEDAAEERKKQVFSLYLTGPHPIRRIEAEYLILATGTYDRPVPFPGWTLPGVITPGAAQMLLKGQRVLPGKRILVAGTGPLLLAVGAHLASAGADVVGVLDVAPLTEAWHAVPLALWGQWTRLAEAWEYWSTLRAHHVPILFGHAVFRAVGDEAVHEAVIGRVDAEGKPTRGTEQTIAVDTVCVGYGLVPSIALSQLLGCQQTYHSQLGAFAPEHQDTMETSVPGVLVAGDATGVGGKPMAMLQGRVASLNILGKLGCLAPETVQARINGLATDIRREKRFAAMLEKRSRIRPGLLSLMDDDTIVCRCEQVTAGQVKESLKDGARDVRGVKNRTRAGMGNCQGRYCGLTLGDMIAQGNGFDRQAVGFASVRLPVVPVLARDLLESE